MNYATEQEALSAAMQYAFENGPIEFDGMNCNDYLEEDEVECGGWDGKDKGKKEKPTPIPSPSNTKNPKLVTV